MLSVWLSFMEIMISLILRLSVWSCDRYAFFTYCWVIVEPPWVPPLPNRSFSAERATPVKDTPGSVQKE